MPYDPNPENGATDVSVYTNLSWTGGDLNPEDTVTYDVYFGNISSPSQVASNQSETYYDPGELENSTTYYWKVVAWDDLGASAEGAIWSFTTEANSPPYTPFNPDPEDGTIDVDINTDISWTGGDPNPEDIVTYDVYFGTTSSPPQVVWEQTGTSYDPGTMNYNTQYYWKIVAWDNQNASAEGPIWSFTTEEDEVAPVIELVKPEELCLYITNQKVTPFITTLIIGPIDIEVNASDDQSGIDRIEFYIDDEYKGFDKVEPYYWTCLLYTSPSPRDGLLSRMPSSA